MTIEHEKNDLMRGRGSVLVRAGNLESDRVQAALELVEDGLAHPSRAKGSGRPIWWVHCRPYPEGEENELGAGFPHMSRRNLE